jgi:hypothetical protein
MDKFSWPQREIRHGIAILIEYSFPNLVVAAPRVDDQEIEIVPATVKDDKPESFRLKIVSHQIRTRQLRQLVRHRLILRMHRIPL